MNVIRPAHEPEYFFVYGTLMEGQRNDLLSQLRASLVGRGTIQAKLYDLGEYPGAKPDHRHQVKGELYRLAKPAQHLTLLDDYEDFVSLRRHSSLFVREQTEVTLEDGRREIAWVYFYNRPVDESYFVAGGDFRGASRTARR
jgi:gamma-glutamylcyclotransferase (GGCT)/AIG2-like uncharacterized protein YtfP